MHQKIKKLLAKIFCGIMIVQSLATPTLADNTQPLTAQASATKLTLSPAAFQFRKPWSGQTTFKTGDWAYPDTQEVATYGARTPYVRFANNDIDADRIKKASIVIDARARASEPTVYLAAIALNDTIASNVETDLSSLTQTLRHNGTAQSSTVSYKFLTNTSGYFRRDAAANVVAYSKSTAGTTPDTKVFYQGTSYSGFRFDLPLAFNMDVTSTVKHAFASSNHVQFVLLPDKIVSTDSGTNVAKISNFANFANGVITDANGNTIQTATDKTLNLTSGKMYGGDYAYLKNEATEGFVDEYYSWLYFPLGSVTMDIEYYTDEELFDLFKSSSTGGESLNENIDKISSVLDEAAFEKYTSIRERTNVNDLLAESLKSGTTLEQFKSSFTSIVNTASAGLPEFAISVKTDLGGARGTITTTGANIPHKSYALIKTFASNGSQTGSFVTDVKDGTGFYNVYKKDNPHAKIEITLTSDEAGTNIISDVKTVNIEKLYFPELFISEISNEHSKTYRPDANKTENHGTEEQYFQYIELVNYNDKPVDLKDYTFVYNDGSDHSFNWVFESDADSTVYPGETYIIGIYSAESATFGYSYATDADMKAYWDGFNTFYNTNVPAGKRVIAPCVESGNASALINGMTHMERSFDAATTVHAKILRGNNVITKVVLPDENPGRSYSYQFIPVPSNSVEETFLYGTGCFPYSLMKEQHLEYCERVYFSSTEDINVLSYNILARDDEGVKVADRFPLFLKTVNNYNPDLIGLQEVNHIWVPYLRNQMPSYYSCVEGLSTKGNTYENNATNTVWDLMNPIYYRNDKFELLASGSAFLTPDGKKGTQQWDSVNMKRTMTWVSLKNKDTGEVVNYVNTHLVLSGKQARVEQVKLLYSKANELKVKYGGGIVVTGDHNFYENSEPYHEYINNGKLVDTRYETTNHVCLATCTNLNTNDEQHGSSIDFCFVSPEDYITQRFDVSNGIYPEGIVSDHSAVYVELVNRKNLIDSVAEVIAYNRANETALIAFDEAKTYTVVFADYSGNVLKNINRVTVTATDTSPMNVVQSDKSFSLGTGDKIMVFEDLSLLKPATKVFTIID